MSKEIEIRKSELLRLIWTRPVSELATEFGMSPNGLAKICDRIDLERPPRGHWRKLGDKDAVIEIPALVGPDEVVVIGGGHSAARKPRSRMSPEERRRQILAEARQIANTSGLGDVTLRSIAKSLGISEAQAHNCFSTRDDLLVELAMEEVLAFEASRQRAVERGGSRVTKVIMSSLDYLREVSRRGPLLQQILRISAIRVRVDERRKGIRASATGRHVVSLQRDKNFSQEEALASLVVLTSMVVRSGTLVSEKRLSLEEVERLCIPIVMASALGASPEAE